MDTSRATVAPISFFAHASLGAGWYIAWRLIVFTAPFWAVPAAIAGALLYYVPGRPEPALVAAGLVLVGLIAAFVASIPITNRVAAGWAMRRWGRRPTKGVWWGIFWRVAVVSLVTSMITGAAQAGAAMYAAVKPWSPEVLFVTLIPYAVMLASLVVTLRSYGWAMSTMVAKRLSGPAAPDPTRDSSAAAEPAPAARAAPLPGPATPGEAMQCPKCGLRETQRGQVIGWHCRVCGWRESRR